MIGNDPFMYSTDFPHEVNAETCKKELGELTNHDALSEEDKDAILYRNAEEFYGFKNG
jgi:predicted TIM-barrel fold metal-dependent hydrolase